MEKHRMLVRVLPDGAILPLVGRECWCLGQLLEAGSRGCTPIERPAPRWSDYVFKLRRHGLVIETIHELHEGPYSGTHGRYVLHSQIEIVKETGKSSW
ncbi:hypothetical protein [Phyllobacterium sp. SB3]|uniref:winged helix domain-containing protein n=1 Tax=Phyllobacterium sp. SB3 TaxID=3156073 RepID=UPI0032AF4A11